MQRIMLLLILLTNISCTSFYHFVYIDKERKVRDAVTRKECVKSFSQYDGDVWMDFYPEPCNIYLERNTKK